MSHMLWPPRTAKRPSLSTYLPQPLRQTHMSGSSLHAQATSSAPHADRPKSYDVDSPSVPPAKAVLLASNRANVKSERAQRRSACGVHTPVARSTSRTDEVAMPSWSLPSRRSTYPEVLWLSSTAMEGAPQISPHDCGGSSTDASALSGSVSTREVGP